jgi:hypothetical protein
MTSEQAALLVPIKTLVELWYALTFHLFERNGIDPIVLANSLELRRKFHEGKNNAEIAQMLKAQIAWLNGLQHGNFEPPTLH